MAMQRRTMTLTAMEFLRRFVQHILPRGFVRIRQSGFLANTCRRRSRGARADPAHDTRHAGADYRRDHETSDDCAPTRATWTCPHCGAAMIVGPILSALQLATLHVELRHLMSLRHRHEPAPSSTWWPTSRKGCVWTC